MLVLDELPRVLRRALGHRVGEECHEAALAARLGGGLAVGQGDGLHLEVHILRRDTLPPPAASQVYRLTDWGAELEPIIRAIGAWAAKSPSMQPGKPMSPASVVLSLRTMFAAEQAAGEHLRLNLVLDGLPYAAQVHARALDIEPGHIDRADVSVNGDPNLLAGVVYAGLPIDDAERAGLSVQGSRDALRRFAGLFPLPDKAAATA